MLLARPAYLPETDCLHALCHGALLLAQVSARGFANLTGIDINISPTLRIAWALESCAPLIQGKLKLAHSVRQLCCRLHPAAAASLAQQRRLSFGLSRPLAGLFCPACCRRHQDARQQ